MDLVDVDVKPAMIDECNWIWADLDLAINSPFGKRINSSCPYLSRDETLASGRRDNSRLHHCS